MVAKIRNSSFRNSIFPFPYHGLWVHACGTDGTLTDASHDKATEQAQGTPVPRRTHKPTFIKLTLGVSPYQRGYANGSVFFNEDGTSESRSEQPRHRSFIVTRSRE